MQSITTAMYHPKQIMYLTGSTGNPSGEGEVSQAEIDKVPFEDGPGSVIPLIALIDGSKYLMGILEVQHQADFWGRR